MSRPDRRVDLGLGGADIGNHRVAMDDADARSLLEAAWAGGVRLFDTAPHYGLGLSERRLGEFLGGRERTGYRVSTKVGRRLVARTGPDGALDDEGFCVPAAWRRVWDFSETGIRSTLEASLTRLGLDRVDTAYLHDPERWDLARGLSEGLAALHRLKQEGVVGAVGVASMRLDALLAAARTGLVDELMVAGRYTLIDQEAAAELLPLCAEQGVAVVAAAVFNGGLLAAEPGQGSTYDYAAASPEILARARRVSTVCQDAGVPLPAAALQFPLRHPAVRSVVVGARDATEIHESCRLVRRRTPDELWERLELTSGATS